MRPLLWDFKFPIPNYAIAKLTGAGTLPSPVMNCRALLDRTGWTPVLHQTSYAALPGPLPSRVLSPPTLTLICLGLASAFLVSLIFRTPFS